MTRRLKFQCWWGCLALSVVPLWPTSSHSAEPVPIIFDTDLGSDVDDAGAVAVLHALADRGEARILAMGVSVAHPWSAPCLDALNTYYGRPDIPIGMLKGPGIDDGCKYAQPIAAEFPHDLKSAAEAPDVVRLYRQILAKQPDASVVLVTVGFLTNVANLLDSPGDEASGLTGGELVRQKVRLWVCMGGGFPTGQEYNLMRDAATARQAVANWPRPIVFSGFEIGEPIQTGAALRGTSENNPVRRAYQLFNDLENRSSWDQTAVLYAVRGPAGKLADVWDLHTGGTIEILPDGSNRWQDMPERNHAYLERKQPSDEVAKTIEGLMVQPPRAAKR
jgi:hypothetical protein